MIIIIILIIVIFISIIIIINNSVRRLENATHNFWIPVVIKVDLL